MTQPSEDTPLASTSAPRLDPVAGPTARDASPPRPLPEPATPGQTPPPLAATIHDPVSDLSYPALVREARPCLNCGYSLQGLSIADRCPECGAAVARSLRGGLLRYASRDYVATLHRSAFVAELSILGRILFVASSFFVPIALVTNIDSHAFGLGRSLFDIASAVVSLLAFWMFTSPDPGYSDAAFTRARRRVRVTLVLALLFAVIRLFTELYTIPAVVTNSEIIWLAYIATWLLVTLMQCIYTMNFLALIASRVPDDELHDAARRFRIQGPLWYGPGLLLCGVGPIVALILYASLMDRARVLTKQTLRLIDADALKPPGE